MKKLLLLFLSVVTLSAFAQIVKKDLEVKLISPQTGDTLSKNTSFNLSFSIKNLGPDSIKVSDTITFHFLVNGQKLPMNLGGGSQTDFTRVSRIDVGDSLILGAQNLALTAPTTTDHASINFCVVVGLYTTDTAGNKEDLDSVGVNNLSCSVLTYKWPTSVKNVSNSSVETNVYPNPVKDVLYVTTATRGEKVFNVFDITGKIVETLQFNESNTELNVSSFNKGIYFYEIRTSKGEMIKSGKFHVNN